MNIIYLIIALVVGFFVIHGIGKWAIEKYVGGKLGRSLASFISFATLALWYGYSYVLVCAIAFSIHAVIGWPVAVLMGIAVVAKGFLELPKDNRHTMQLASERRKALG